MPFELQPILENEYISLRPLEASDFDALYAVASDPLIWEQHPNPDRCEPAGFRAFFDEAMLSKGALLVFDTTTQEVIGTSRYYELDIALQSVAIGYTFLGRSHWGGFYNTALKALMIQYAFERLDTIIFHVGSFNIRSQKAVEKLGAEKVDEINRGGEADPKPYFVYKLVKNT